MLREFMTSSEASEDSNSGSSSYPETSGFPTDSSSQTSSGSDNELELDSGSQFFYLDHDQVARDAHNQRVTGVLYSKLKRAVEDDGMDVYIFLAFYGVKSTRSKKSKRIAESIHSLVSIIVVMLMQIVVPIILLIHLVWTPIPDSVDSSGQIIASNPRYLPQSNSILQRLVGSIMMLYSFTSLKLEIVEQFGWLYLFKAKLLHRIGYVTPPRAFGKAPPLKPRVWVLYLGVYVNLINAMVIIIDTYLMGCQSQNISDYVLNVAVLNFLIQVDNSSFRLLASHTEVEKAIIEGLAAEKSEILKHLKRSQLKLGGFLQNTVEIYIFWFGSIVSISLPILFGLYKIWECEFDF